MKSRLALLLGALFLVSGMTVTAVAAEDPAQAPVAPPPVASAGPAATSLGPMLELLRKKQIISDAEAKTLLLVEGSDAQTKTLVELLKSKGLISEAEAAKVSSVPVPAAPVSEALGEKVLPASQDAKFIAQLRVRWVKNKNRGRDFDEWFAGISDPEEIIARMRVIGAIGSDEADEIERYYRDHYMTGAISAALQEKEPDYLERVRKGVAWELDEKIKEKFKGEWSQRIKLGGDFRLRYEQDIFDANNGDFLNPSNPTQIMNSTVDRQMLRIRARLGVDVKLSDTFQLGMGIASGGTTNPTSNVTLGGSFAKYPIALDKAFLKWSPAPSLDLLGGRFANPWFFTDLVWFPDLNFDGVALQCRPRITDLWSLFLTTGIFPVQEVELSQHDKWLFGSQVGAQYGSSDGLFARFAVAWYDFMNTTGVVNDPAQPGLKDWTAPLFQQKGNTLMDIDPSSAIKTAYASAFRELNLTGSLDLGYWHPVHVVLSADYVNNLGFNQAAVNARTGSDVKKETEGFQVGLSVGYPALEEFGDWKGSFSYKYLEADAVMDAFADQDFHLGGTNARGWIAGADLGLGKNVWLSTRWFSADQISGPPLSIDVLHVNINARF